MPISVLHVVDLAGCETPKEVKSRSKIDSDKDSSSSSLHALLRGIAHASNPSAVSGAQESVVSCQLVSLLQEHLLSTKKGAISVIHTMNPQLRDFEDTVSALNALKTIPLSQQQNSRLTDDHFWDDLDLCRECFSKKDLIEEHIRDMVVTELHERCQNPLSSSDSNSKEKCLSFTIQQIVLQQTLFHPIDPTNRHIR